MLAYFDKNWKTCVDMWVNFGREQYFSVGNTTTNRIEANWNQVKLLTGHRPRIDKCVAALLAHQVAVFRQFSSATTKHATHSRQGRAVPPFLRHAAARLSGYAFLRKEFDIVHHDMPDARCERIGVTEWEVSTNFRTYKCDEESWSCSCLFFCNTHLPCRHLMIVASAGLKSVRLPVEAVDSRWCMRVADQMNPIFKDGCDAISRVLNLVKTKPRQLSGIASTDLPVAVSQTQLAPLLPGSSDSECLPSESDTLSRSSRRVSYVRLYRGEHASMVVLTSNEKYRCALSAVESILDGLAQLDTVRFFSRLSELGSVALKFGERLEEVSTDDGDEELVREDESLSDTDVDDFAFLKKWI